MWLLNTIEVGHIADALLNSLDKFHHKNSVINNHLKNMLNIGTIDERLSVAGSLCTKLAVGSARTGPKPLMCNLLCMYLCINPFNRLSEV